MSRLFVGAWLPAEGQGTVADYPRPPTTDVRWSTPSQWLISIRPLGGVHASVVPDLIDALRFELDGAPALEVRFGSVYREGWLMVHVDGLEELTAVVFEATEPVVPVTHRQTWHAHVVLARGKVPKELVQPLTGSWTVTSVVLAKATRGKDGPGYEDIERFSLGGA